MNRKLSSKLRTADGSQEVTIFRVPLSIRESNKIMFEPSVVSIGPYHRGRPHLNELEEKKWSFLQDFLNRTGCALQDCINKIKEVEKQARCCYSEPFNMNSGDFVEMMVLDGCFIIGYLAEPITEGWNSSMIETDLILLENQIPYFIIETLLGFRLNQHKLKDIAHKLTRADERSYIPLKDLSGPQKIHHLLHLCLCFAVPSDSTQDATSEPILCPFFSKKKEELDEEMIWEIPCATELEEAGVKFKKSEQSDDITKITFHSGTLEIPYLHISDYIKPILMNLVAMEQCKRFQLRRHFSTYMWFLDKLINTAHDVKILQKNGIIQSMLSSEEEVALFFNQSSVGTTIPSNHYLKDLFKKVNKYRDYRYHRYRAKLSRDYFNNPWSTVAFIAATLILCLTIIQSFMSVFAYILPPPSGPSS